MIVAGFLPMMATLYVASYFACMREESTTEYGGNLDRYFGPMWVCALYSPAARVEAVLTGSVVSVVSLDESKAYDAYPNYDDWFSVCFHRMMIPENARKAGWWWR